MQQVPLAPMPPFVSLKPSGGYLPLEDYGLIGDCASAALVGRDGAVSWLCLPHFDNEAAFCHLLDRDRGGAFVIAPEGLAESRQAYVPDSGILVTEMRGPTGTVRVTDGMTFKQGADLTEGTPVAREELIRSAVVLEGNVRLNVELLLRGGATFERRASGWHIRCATRPDLNLQLDVDRQLAGERTVYDLKAGDRLTLTLRWGSAVHRYRPYSPEEVLGSTVQVWHKWLGDDFSYNGAQQTLVRRSAITLKLLDYAGSGAILAAPTTSLPESIGGVRNWDYRYAWVRDAAFSVYALRRIGLTREASAFLAWVLEVIDRQDWPRVLYTVHGELPPPEREDPELAGYRDSRPVRWGNNAIEQRQHDVFGEILDCAFQWGREATIDEHLWRRLAHFIRSAARQWREPDRGIWEVRTPGRPYTYSAALCQVALDRGARLAEQFGLPGEIEAWRAEAATIREAILQDAWDPEQNALTESLGGGSLDASVLALPMRRVIRAEHPRMKATVDAIVRHLGAGQGLLYRYNPDESPDGLPGHEGAFLLCSFWLVDNLTKQGRIDEAHELYRSLCSRANHLGLLPEQIDPATGDFLGNYPQAFSHVGVISSGVALARQEQVLSAGSQANRKS